MENTNQNNVLNFSEPQKHIDDESITTREVYEQLRNRCVKILNIVATKNCEITPEAKKALRIYNRYCKVVGLEPLEYPF